MRLPIVGVVLAALLLSGCSSASGPLEVGGTGIAVCIPEGAGGDFAVLVPLQNSGDNDVTITAVTLNARGNLLELGPVVLDDVVAANDGTLASASGGATSDVENWDSQVPAVGAVIEAGTRVSLGIPLERGDSADVGTFSGVTVAFDGGSTSSSVSATLQTTC